MRRRLTILLAASPLCTSVLAQARPETWSCHAPGGGEALVVAAHQGGDTGTISVAGTEHSTHYEVEGFNRRWSFGPRTLGTGLRFQFLIEPDGDGAYFDLAEGTGSQQRYRCEQPGEVAERASRLDDVRRERAALDQPPVENQIAIAGPASAARLRDQYMLMIENHVKRFWDRPLSARPGIECSVNVVQLPTGEVMSANITQCNGDDAVRRSIERAVMDASPLPRAPSEAVFARTFTLLFAPDE